jgi:hypothetical protein
VSEQLVDQSLFLKFGSGSESSGPLSHHVARLADREFDMVMEIAVPLKDVMGHEADFDTFCTGFLNSDSNLASARV